MTGHMSAKHEAERAADKPACKVVHRSAASWPYEVIKTADDVYRVQHIREGSLPEPGTYPKLSRALHALAELVVPEKRAEVHAWASDAEAAEVRAHLTESAARERAKPDPGVMFPTVEDGLTGMEFVEAALESSRNGNVWVKV